MDFAHDDLRKMWDKYADNPSEANKSELITAYLPLVRIVAHKTAKPLPKHINEDDLTASGIFGLIESIERFNPHKSVKFENFAHFRIRGAMLDEIRSLDWVPRSVRARGKQLHNAREQFSTEHGREATNEEIAAILGVDVDRFHEIDGETKESEWLVSLNEMHGSSEGETAGPMDFLPSLNSLVDDEVVEADELGTIKTKLGAALSVLPDRQILTLAFYYLWGMTLSEVGDVLGVSESRVCQIQTKALSSLRDVLEPTDLEPG